MWSDVNKEYVKELVLTNRSEYPYYIAVTCSYWGTYYDYNRPTFKVYFSKEPITADGLYNYVFEDTAVVYSVIGGNANNNSNECRVQTSTYNGTLNIDDYEFVYTNAEFETNTVQPDILSTNLVTQSHFDGVSLILLGILLGTIVAKIVKGKY